MYVDIDGSMGEGGGQILRYSIALSALLLKPVHIYNIRAKRSNPGLRPQHLTAVKALAQISKADVKGDHVGSTELWFKPNVRRGGHYRFDIGTAGSVTLVLQAVFPALIFTDSDSVMEITGGTDVPWSPTIDYMRFVFAENLRRLFGISISIDVKKRGHYPKGGGFVIARVKRIEEELRPINLVRRSDIRSIKGRSHCVRLPSHVAFRQAKSAEEYLYKKLNIKPIIDVEYYEKSRDPHLGPGSGIVLYADCGNSIIGSDSLGAKGKPAEKVGEEAASKLVEELYTWMSFDRHMGDMLIPYLSLACGRSKIGVSKLTLHTVTALEVTRIFLPNLKYSIEGELGKPSIITIEGICFKAMDH